MGKQKINVNMLIKNSINNFRNFTNVAIVNTPRF